MHDNFYDRYEKEEFCHFFVLKTFMFIYDLCGLCLFFDLWKLEHILMHKVYCVPSNYSLFSLDILVAVRNLLVLDSSLIDLSDIF